MGYIVNYKILVEDGCLNMKLLSLRRIWGKEVRKKDVKEFFYILF